MKTGVARLALLLATVAAGAAGAAWSGEAALEQEQTFRAYRWDDPAALRAVRKEHAPGRAFTVRAAEGVKDPDGAPALEIAVQGDEAGGQARQLWFVNQYDLTAGEAYFVRFWVRSRGPAPLSVTAYRDGGDWAALGKGPRVDLEAGPEWREVVLRRTAELEGHVPLRMPSLFLDRLRAGDVLEIGSVVIGREKPVPATLNPVRLHRHEWNDKTAAASREFAADKDFTTAARDGKLEITIVKHDGKPTTQRRLWLGTRLDAKPGRVYRMRFSASADAPGALVATAYQDGGKWAPLGTVGTSTFDIGPEEREIVWTCDATLDWHGALRMPEFRFGGFDAGTTLRIGPVEIEEMMPFQPLAAVGAPAVSADGPLAAFSAGRRLFCGLPFPRGEIREITESEPATLEWSAPLAFGDHLYLLHTGDGLPNGEIGRVAFLSGGRVVKSTPVRVGRELGELKNPRRLPNGLPGERASDGQDALGLYVSQFPLPAEAFDAIRLERAAGAGRWLLFAASLTPMTPDPQEIAREKVVADREWRPIDTKRLYVRAGSALDFSDLVERVPCGTYGRVVANAEGRTAFADAPDRPVRFFGFSMTPMPENMNKTDAELDAFVDALAAQGYNMLRFHGTNSYLMSRARFDGNFYDDPETIPFIPEHEDRFHYLLHRLKQRGIYVYLDLAAFAPGWTTAPRYTSNPPGFVIRLLAGEAEYRANYRAGVLRMLRAANPYTGQRLADDPTIAVVLFWNEQNLQMRISDFVGKTMQPRWIQFLKDKYKTLEAVRAAWVEDPPAADADWGDLPLFNMPATQKETVFAQDMAECIAQCEIELTRWYHGVIEESGYAGLTTQWDFIYRLGEIAPRATVPAVSMHAYHAHPSHYISAGSRVPQSGVFSSGCSMMRVMAPVRFIDRPYLVSEYGNVFWNQYRHEQGLASAYAALQDWDLMMVHAKPVMEEGQRIVPFIVGGDPVIRASEAVTAHVYLRGDVASARRTVVFPVDDAFIFQKNRPFSAFNGHLSFLFAVSRVGLRYAGDTRAQVRADLDVPALGGSTFNDFGMYGTVTDTYRGSDALQDALSRMRQAGLIGPENLTDPEKRIYQSDTGELTMRLADGGLFDVVTPRLEGCLVKGNAPRRLDRLTVEAAGCPASVVLIARDGDKTLADARRLLLVLSTNALNNGMSFTDDTRNRLVDIGGLPVLMQSGRFEIAFGNDALKSPVAYALHLDGARGDRLPLVRREGAWRLSLDTAALPLAGPTPFFEIVEAAEP